eukprot:CAMPEP_0119384182 /NCGR_PEP_ID=MMETSP1334-20130426/84074_1 /TAXON_ID=127549 /ORGANISM="Calcidiscus leptoporus, Strain RCC1130" /LENGTH=539 /DNA_ID=CAMNT_0007405159 /DNA_START=55 /DNA_END=1674 /DNA_ORIENTATION=+
MNWPPADCRFRFGRAFRGADFDYSGVDYLTVWIGQSGEQQTCSKPPCFNEYWHGAMLKLALQMRISAAYYAYIVAFLAKTLAGLHDCDMGEPSLCRHGANFIRTHIPTILATYDRFANETALRMGRTAPVLWLIEPDWHQYHEPSQEGGGLLVDEMVDLFKAITFQIFRHLPAAKISLDISPWVNQQEEWLRPFIRQCTVHFVHTSGGRTSADSERIRASDDGNYVTWKQVHQLSGLGIIADTGYGVGGLSHGHDHQWDDTFNLRKRIADGVVAVTQSNPEAGWPRTIEKARGLLPLPQCDWRDPVYSATVHGQLAVAEQQQWQAGLARLSSYYALLGALVIGLIVGMACALWRRLRARSPWARLSPRVVAPTEAIIAQVSRSSSRAATRAGAVGGGGGESLRADIAMQPVPLPKGAAERCAAAEGPPRARGQDAALRADVGARSGKSQRRGEAPGRPLRRMEEEAAFVDSSGARHGGNKASRRSPESTSSSRCDKCHVSGGPRRKPTPLVDDDDDGASAFKPTMKGGRGRSKASRAQI